MMPSISITTNPCGLPPIFPMSEQRFLKEGDLLRWKSMPKDVYEVKNIQNNVCDLVRIVADRSERMYQVYAATNIDDIQADIDSPEAIIKLVEFSTCFDCKTKFEDEHFLCEICRENQ